MIYQQGRKMKNVLKLVRERVHRMQILAGNTVSQVKWEWWNQVKTSTMHVHTFKKVQRQPTDRKTDAIVAYVARTLQKCQRVRVGFAKSSVFLKNPRRVRHQKWRVRATKIVATPLDYTRILHIMAWVNRKYHSGTIWCGRIIRLTSNCKEYAKYYEHKNFH